MHSLIRIGFVMVLVAGVGATVRVVPDDLPTIQEALNASVPFDTVLVSPGVYFENLTMGQNGLLLTSRLLEDGDSSWVEQTVIDGGGLGPVLWVTGSSNDLLHAPKIQGLVLQHGICGVYVNYGALVLRRAIVQDNTASNGAGLRMTEHIDSMRVVLEDVLFQRNQATRGGAIYSYLGTGSLFSSLQVSRCHFLENGAEEGGVLFLQASTGSTHHEVAFEDCLMEDNQARSGAISYAVAATGMASIQMEINHCQMRRNHSAYSTLYWNAGTGFSRQSLSISDCQFEDCRSDSASLVTAVTDREGMEFEMSSSHMTRNWAMGSMLLVSGNGDARVRAQLNQVLLADNQVLDHVIQYTSSADNSALVLTHCTLVGNLGLTGSALSVNGSDSYSINSVFWQPGVTEIQLNGGGLGFSHCLVEGGEAGVDLQSGQLHWEEGNLAATPSWLTDPPGDYTPALDSPLVDAGTAFYQPGWGLLADSLLVDDTAFLGVAPEIGWREVDATLVAPWSPVMPALELSAWPNPFNPITTLHYDLPRVAAVSLELFDLAGRRVAQLAQGREAAGVHRVAFDGAGLASGLYLARLEAGGQSRVQRLLLVK